MPASGKNDSGPSRVRWASDDDFKRHREAITNLYKSTTLAQLMHVMETQHDFFATSKMYKRRFRLWNLWKHDTGSKSLGDSGQSNLHDYYAVSLCRNPMSKPHDSPELRHEEMMYRAISDYYDAAFSARRWVFNDSTITAKATGQDLIAHQLAVERTDQAFEAGEEVWLRFWAGLNMLERPSRGSNGGKEEDFGEGVRLMRVAFAELSYILSDCEPPLLFLCLMHIMVLFRESSVSGFDFIETQLIKHLYGLTSTTNGTPQHATAPLWRVLWSGGRGIPRDRYHLRMCTAIALEMFTQYLGYFHPWTVELNEFGIDIMYAAGAGNPDEKTTRLRTLLQQLETLEVYDSRHVNIVCCLSNHYRQHAHNEDGQRMLKEAVEIQHLFVDFTVCSFSWLTALKGFKPQRP
ncbi:hypothetical protein QBC36DRAFT_199160 [Triangularia setosa]|uniref:Clr5 domain-containing protein n=1 Tax=Triangularia setosa TaxID=2587417 RepID=A0AAN6VXA5_9PEZI|nr:hypothetical protein QBC36DRAFT_199160 [Podospora setosa]